MRMAVEAHAATLGGDAPAPAAPDGPAGTGPRWLLAALLGVGVAALVGCLLAGGTVGTTSVVGLPDAGSGTAWALPVATFIAETSAVLGFGAALLAAVLIPAGAAADPSRNRAVRTAGGLSWLAAGATLVVFVLTLSELTALPLPQAFSADAAVQLATFGPGRLLLIAAGLSAVGGVVAFRAGRRRRTATAERPVALMSLMLLMAGALIPWAIGGHATQSSTDIATSSMIVHVLAAGAWTGGLAVIVLHVRGDLLVTVLPRFSTLALGCWAAIGVSGVITGWLRITSVADLLTSQYGRLLLVKLALLGVLGVFGWWHRRRLAAGLRRQSIGERRALLRLAAAEVLVMGLTMGVATALSGTAPTAAHPVGHDLVHGTSRIENMVGHKLPVISTENLLLLWRPDVIAVLLTTAVLCSYLLGVRRYRATGAAWPVRRICWAVGAAVLAVIVLNGGPASYDNAVWSVTVTQQAITSMAIPVAIALARPLDLFARGDVVGRRPSRASQAVLGSHAPVGRRTGALLGRHPVAILTGYLAWTALVLLTPVALWSVTNHAVLMVCRIGDMVVGAALFIILLPAQRTEPADVPAADSTPEHVGGSGRVARRGPLLIAWFVGETAVSAWLLAGGAVAARPWFAELNIAWITAEQDEHTAALLRFGIAVIVLVIAMLANERAAVGALPRTQQQNLLRIT